MKEEIRFRGNPDDWPWQDLLVLFNSFPELFRSDAERARSIRSRIKELLEHERDSLPPELRGLFVLKLLLLCPEFCEFQGREGFEWVAEEFRDILDRQAIALGLGLKEKDLYSRGRTTGRSGHRKFADCSFQGYLEIALNDLKSLGRPSELARDIHRAELVEVIKMNFSWNKTQAKRYVAALEGAEKAGAAARGRRIQVNIGTDKRPRLIDLARQGDRPETGPNAKILDVSQYEPSARQIDRSLENVKKQGLTLVIEQENGQTKITVVPRRFLPIIRDCRKVADIINKTD